jgi:signal transduction histidine kinase
MDIKESDVPDGLKVVIFRVMQEALNNVARHSQADHVCISLLKKNATIEFAVRDTGIGFRLGEVNDADHPDKGMGLFSMKERVELGGGSFAIQTGRGSGTLVRTSYSVRQERCA